MKKQNTFENGMQELEALVAGMESGNLPLEESFQAYKRGMELYNALMKMLDEGDKRIRELTLAGDMDITSEVTAE